MGGCRCTYRNCQASSGGGLHFFHYPVFDKVRCHQWIANGRRYDLLDLKLSQLKNRVVCQRHFRDEMFMNYKKDRLTCNAVPTEDGPVSFEKSLENSTIHQNTACIDQLSVEENKISGEDDTKYYTVREKAATLSVPYKVFLEKSTLESLNDPELRSSIYSHKTKTSSPERWVSPRIKSSTMGHLARPKVLNAARKKIKRCPVKAKSPIKQETVPDQAPNMPSTTSNNVVILSEKRLSPPLPLLPLPTLTKASPSFVIKKLKYPVTMNTPSSDTIIEEPPKYSECMNYFLLPDQSGGMEGVLQTVPTDPLAIDGFCPSSHLVTTVQAEDNNITVYPPIIPTLREAADISHKVDSNQNTPVLEKTVRPLHRGWINKSKFKVSPEKRAEINRKRRFNMSLKEAVERTLDGVHKSRPVPASAPFSTPAVASAPTIHSKEFDEQASCNKEQEMLSGVSSTLLSAVEENKRDIAEIKRILLGNVRPVVTSKPSTKVDKQTGTQWSEISKKKYLFSEISQYLSDSLKSSLYEELFLSTVLSKRHKVMK